MVIVNQDKLKNINAFNNKYFEKCHTLSSKKRTLKASTLKKLSNRSATKQPQIALHYFLQVFDDRCHGMLKSKLAPLSSL